MADLIRLPVLRETHSSKALVVSASDRAEDCDGARTLQLVEHAVESMQELRARAEHISARASDLIRLTHRERAQLQAELSKAREDARQWERRAEDAERALAQVSLELREADLARREAEMATQLADTRAEDAEARAGKLEFYLKKIDGYLQARLTALA
ncbi:MAG: hypothetical protein K2Y56_08750 [Methylobacterium sp.]|uniref:hypothetical protein n=1 Tax=Methylobacterium sp. TaxID=409 RepID=UPI0025CBD277|nr:hypothetical protein [Methylobacterium sp.]MBX9931611.1 hypothetical protein [Methylobacterium sp.]